MEIILDRVAEVPHQPKNTYELIVHTEHGDADFNETHKVSGSEEEIILYLKAINAYFGLDWNTTCSKKPLSEAMVAAVGGEGFELLHDLVGYDKKYEGAGLMARVVDYDVFWYNENGTKYHCKVVGCRARHGDEL